MMPVSSHNLASLIFAVDIVLWSDSGKKQESVSPVILAMGAASSAWRDVKADLGAEESSAGKRMPRHQREDLVWIEPIPTR